jgi:hypothetical protein
MSWVNIIQGTVATNVAQKETSTVKYEALVWVQGLFYDSTKDDSLSSGLKPRIWPTICTLHAKCEREGFPSAPI